MNTSRITTHMVTHRIWEDSGAEKFIAAESDKAARAEAREWVADGSYSRGDDDLADESFFAHAYTRNLLTGDSYTDDVLVDLSPEEPVCLSDEDGIELEHDWRDDGAWSVHGTQTVTRATCQRCGLLRRETSETTAGQLPHEPAKTSYARAVR